MKRLIGVGALVVCSGLLGASLSCAQSAPADGEWVSLFDGKTLSGWEMLQTQPNGGSEWSVVDGALTGSGTPSMLFSPRGDYKNFIIRAEIKINDGGNSGLYFRANKEASFGAGIEAQIDATHKDPIRTGSLYGMLHVYKQYHQPDEWFTYEVRVEDSNWRNRPVTIMTVSINGEELYRYLDFVQDRKAGHFAFQQHDPGSTVSIRKIEVMELP